MVIACFSCAIHREVKPATGGSPRMPSTWKCLQDRPYCPDCWKRYYLPRSISIPVASPLDCTWEELRARLTLAWRESTAACNWMMTELYARDLRRGNEPRMPPMPRVYLYPQARLRYPNLPSGTLATLEHACQRKYRSVRYGVIWTNSASLPTYRYPTPFPVPSQGWQATLDGGCPVVSLRLGDSRLRLRLKGGPRFRRQIQAFGLITTAHALPGEASILSQGATLMVRMAAWLPRQHEPGAPGHEGTLSVITRRDCLFTAGSAKEERLWTYNADHLRRWQAEHSRQLQRWSEDHRHSPCPNPDFAARREAAALKYRHRMDSACHEIAARLAGYALRRRFAAVAYDDRERGFCPQLPWYRLRALIAEKLDEAGIELQFGSSQDTDETEEMLAEA